MNVFTLLVLLILSLMAYSRYRRGSRRGRRRPRFGSRRSYKGPRRLMGYSRFPRRQLASINWQDSYTFNGTAYSYPSTGYIGPYAFTSVGSWPVFIPLNMLNMANGPGARLGRRVLGKSIHVTIEWYTAFQAGAANAPSVASPGFLTAAIVYDRQWNKYNAYDAKIPMMAGTTMDGDSTLGAAVWSALGQSAAPVGSGVLWRRNMDNRDRFKICKEKITASRVTDAIQNNGTLAAIGTTFMQPQKIEMFCKLGGAETIWDSTGDNNAAKPSSIINGAILLALQDTTNGFSAAAPASVPGCNIVRISWRYRYMNVLE